MAKVVTCLLKLVSFDMFYDNNHE